MVLKGSFLLYLFCARAFSRAYGLNGTTRLNLLLLCRAGEAFSSPFLCLRLFLFSWSKYLPLCFSLAPGLILGPVIFVLRSRTASSGVGFELSESIFPVGRDPANSLSMVCLPAYSRRFGAWNKRLG